MAQHDTPGAPAGERLLREIAEREQELQRRVAEARAEAARLIDQAQQEADALRAQAREQARALEEAAATEAAREGEQITRDILARAEADAARIRREAEGRKRQAVDLVVAEVLGGAP